MLDEEKKSDQVGCKARIPRRENSSYKTTKVQMYLARVRIGEILVGLKITFLKLVW